MPEDAKRRNSRKKKKRKAAKKRSFFQSIFSAVKYVVLSINRYTTRTDDRGPDREFHLGRHKLTFVGFMALLLVLLVVILLAFNGHSVKVANESIIVTGLPDDFEGYRILHISDLAGKNFGEGQSTLMRVIDNLSYNAVVLTGDMVGKSGDPQPLYDLIEALGTRRPVYFIAGDSDPAPLRTEARDNSLGTMTLNQMVLSDWVLGAIDHGAIYLDAPTQIVKNKSTMWLTPESMLDVEASPLLSQLNAQYRLESAEVVAGGTAARTALPLTAWRVQCAEKLLNAVSTMKNEDLHIAVAHYPPIEAYNAASGYSGSGMLRTADLVLAGHYCGGGWKLPGLGAIYIPAIEAPRHGWLPDQTLVEGERLLGGVNVYTTGGLGMSDAIPLSRFRLNNQPKVTILTLTAALTDDLLGVSG